MKSIALLALIVSLMLFASCAMMPQWAVDRLSQLRPDSHVKVSESISRPASDMGKKRPLGEYIRQVSNLLEEAKEYTAHLELKRSLYYYPNNDVLTTLKKQIFADPKAILGDKFTYYTIQPNDTLSTIAQDKLGNGLLFYLLAKYNDIETPRVINVGQYIKIPTPPEPSKPVERTPEIAATHPRCRHQIVPRAYKLKKHRSNQDRLRKSPLGFPRQPRDRCQSLSRSRIGPTRPQHRLKSYPQSKTPPPQVV